MKLSVSAPKAIPAVRVGQICSMSRDDTAFNMNSTRLAEDWERVRSLPSQTPQQDLSPHTHWPERKDFEERAG
jgi:hypothetical protein